MANPFAAGKREFAFCDVCGFRCDLKALRKLVVKTKVTETKACSACWVPDQPQLLVGMTPVIDPQGLREPRPDTSQAASRALLVPVTNVTYRGHTWVNMSVGSVVVTTV